MSSSQTYPRHFLHDSRKNRPEFSSVWLWFPKVTATHQKSQPEARTVPEGSCQTSSLSPSQVGEKKTPKSHFLEKDFVDNPRLQRTTRSCVGPDRLPNNLSLARPGEPPHEKQTKHLKLLHQESSMRNSQEVYSLMSLEKWGRFSQLQETLPSVEKAALSS